MNDEILTRVWSNLMSRPSGPLSFRFVIQPAMAIFLGIRAGLRDAKSHRPAYLWAIITRPEHRRELLKSGWNDIAMVFCLAIALDVIFQVMIFQQFFPIEAILVGTVLACIPYVIVRGLINRICRK